MINPQENYFSLEKQFKKFSLSPWEPKVLEIHKNRIVEGAQPREIGQHVRSGSEGTITREEKVLKKDERVHVSSTRCFPQSSQVFLKMDFGDEANHACGSGQMIGPYHVLTCAHNIYDFKNSKWADEISVYPGANGKGNYPFGKIAAVKAIIPQDYTLGKKVGEEADIALILLEKKIGYETGWASFAYLQDDEFNDLEIYVSGYPGDRKARMLNEMKGRVVKKKTSILYYNISTSEGQSGSPVWRKLGFPLVLGVHCRRGVDGKEWNEGTRISEKYFDWITSCMEMNHAAATCKERDQGCKVECLDFERINILIHFCEKGIKYTGQYKEGKEKGYATPTPKKQGFGLSIDKNGERYKGHFHDNQRHGQGVCTYSDGSIYAGLWRYGKKEGEGTLTWRDGSYYKGPFHQDQRNGHGICQDSDKSLYIGKWEKDKKHGFGNLTYPDGSFYRGEFYQNEKHGQGTSKCSGGIVYEGHWRHGRKEGIGKLTWTDRKNETHTYEGGFYDDLKHGHGTEKCKGVSLYTGPWRNNKQGEYSSPKSYNLNEIYGQDNSPKKVIIGLGKNDEEEIQLKLKLSENDQVCQEQDEPPKEQPSRRSLKKSQSFEVDNETMSELCYLVNQFAGGQRIFDPSKLIFEGEKKS